MRTIIFALLGILISCQSLPSRIAEHSAAGDGVCWDASIRTARALQALEYKDVSLCAGEVYPWLRPLHAWVEYTDDDGDTIVIDPHGILDDGVIEYRRDILTPSLYKVMLRYELSSLSGAIPTIPAGVGDQLASTGTHARSAP